MNYITEILYWISTGLMIPVILLLLFFLIKALLTLGDIYASYTTRSKYTGSSEEFVSALEGRINILNDKTHISKIETQPAIKQSLLRMQKGGWKKILCEKVLADFETDCEKKLSPSRSLLRIGPMLGLMGTLIPMGPALVSLAAGDIGSMAVNMQVAFSTTVIGIFTGAVGFIANQLKNRWFIEDMNDLEFIYSSIAESLNAHNEMEEEYEEEKALA